MVKTGIALIFDNEFRNSQKCSICEQRIGNEDFSMEFELQPRPGVIGYKHLRCMELAEKEFLKSLNR